MESKEFTEDPTSKKGELQHGWKISTRRFTKIALLICCTITAGFFSYAQKAVSYGIKGGLNIGSLQYRNVADDQNSPRLSFHAGGLAHIHLNKTWALQPEALVSKEGFNQDYNNSSLDWEILYFNVPVMLQYMFANGFRLELGPQFGFRLNARVSNGGDKVNATSSYNQLNFSAAGGISYLSKFNVGIGARYTKGLTDITQGSYNYVSTDVVQVSVFYLLKKKSHK